MNTSFLFRPATARDFPAILALQNAVVPLLPEEQFYPDGPDFWQHCLQRGGCLLLALAAPQHKEASSAAEGAAEDELGNEPGNGLGQTRLAPADLPKIACLPRVAVCAAETDGAGTSLCPADPVPAVAGGEIALGTRFAWPLWVQCLLLLPMDLAAWPVCLEVWKTGSLPLVTRRFAFLLALLLLLGMA